LKALLDESGVALSKTHDIGALLALLQPRYASLRRFRRGLRFLTLFAVDPRYPLLRTTKRQARAALRWAGEVREACRALLGIRPPSRRRKHKT
jgi:HEPN domain-containing protein